MMIALGNGSNYICSGQGSECTVMCWFSNRLFYVCVLVSTLLLCVLEIRIKMANWALPLLRLRASINKMWYLLISEIIPSTKDWHENVFYKLQIILNKVKNHFSRKVMFLLVQWHIFYYVYPWLYRIYLVKTTPVTSILIVTNLESNAVRDFDILHVTHIWCRLHILVTVNRVL